MSNDVVQFNGQGMEQELGIGIPFNIIDSIVQFLYDSLLLLGVFRSKVKPMDEAITKYLN